jgi:hypothetical protein
MFLCRWTTIRIAGDRSATEHVKGSHPGKIESPEATVAAIMAADKATQGAKW